MLTDIKMHYLLKDAIMVEVWAWVYCHKPGQKSSLFVFREEAFRLVQVYRNALNDHKGSNYTHLLLCLTFSVLCAHCHRSWATTYSERQLKNAHFYTLT